MTANAMASDRDRCIESGMNDFVSKPFDPPELYAALARWTEHKATADSAGPVLPPRDSTEAEDIPPLEGIDREAGLRHLAGNKKLYRKLLGKFIDSQSGAPAEISTALETGDDEEARRLAHSVKGVAGNIGAIQLQEACQVLETAIKEQQPEENTGPLLEKMAEELERVCGSIRDMKGVPSAAAMDGSGGIDNDAIKPLLEELILLIEEDDTGAGRALEQLLERASGTPLASRLIEAKMRLESYDFEAALEMVREVAANLGDGET
ncbi:MAG: Hpt domain-containing protein, partial [Candidatus Sedimenticola sp. 20ELBAFRAG]